MTNVFESKHSRLISMTRAFNICRWFFTGFLSSCIFIFFFDDCLNARFGTFPRIKYFIELFAFSIVHWLLHWLNCTRFACCLFMPCHFFLFVILPSMEYKSILIYFVIFLKKSRVITKNKKWKTIIVLQNLYKIQKFFTVRKLR